MGVAHSAAGETGPTASSYEKPVNNGLKALGRAVAEASRVVSARVLVPKVAEGRTKGLVKQVLLVYNWRQKPDWGRIISLLAKMGKPG